MNPNFKDRLRVDYEEVMVAIKELKQKQAGLSISPNPSATVVMETTSRLSELIDKLFVINSSRHQTMGSDVEYLNFLEYGYFRKGDTDNLIKASDIEIHPDYIIIAGVKLARRNEIDVFSFSQGRLYLQEINTVFFSLEGVIQYIKQSEGIGIPTDKEWRAIIKAIPGNTGEEITKNLKGILNLNLTGICGRKDGKNNLGAGIIMEGFDVFGAYWSGDSVINNKKTFLYFKNGVNTIASGDFNNSMVALRCKIL